MVGAAYNAKCTIAFFERQQQLIEYLNMQQKQEKQGIEQQNIRYQLLPLFTTHTQSSIIPLNPIQLALQFVPFLQMLKFPIDYFTQFWLGYSQPIFSFLDASYYLTNSSAQANKLVLLISVILMTIYWAVNLLLFLLQVKYSNVGLNIRKFLFMIARNILFLPFFNIVINTNFCENNQPLKQCFTRSSDLRILTTLSFVFFAALVLAQSFFNFSFIGNPKEFTVIKRSSYFSVALLVYIMVNQYFAYATNRVVQIMALDVSSILLLLVFWVKDEHLIYKMKLVQLSFLGVNMLAILMLNIIYFTDQHLSLVLFFLLSAILVLGISHLKLYSLKFQLQNINKWTTSEIAIRYANNLRYYLSRRDQYLFKIYIHGYMEIHRQKCDSPTCPSRCEFSESEKKALESGKLKEEDKQIVRAENIVRKIYCDGLRQTPISVELQLDYAIFLYELGEKQLSLKDLLSIRYEQLTYDKYYKYVTLKYKIHREMCQQPQKSFLDLVSQLNVKREEDLILSKFEKAALTNLEFWSVLNEDHPDFQKLNEVGAKRIAIGREVRQSYRNISKVVLSEKITSLYVNYLQAVENDEDMYNQIYQAVKQEYELQDKIVLQDWANSSNAIMLVSMDQSHNGTIIDINSSCASIFGFQRYEILNRPLDSLFCEELHQTIKEFLSLTVGEEQIFYMSHKSGYILKATRSCQNYNSMQTGMSFIITLKLQTSPNQCFFLLQHSHKIFAVSSSIISLLGLQLKILQAQLYAKDFFDFPIEATSQEEKTITFRNILKIRSQNEGLDLLNRMFRLKIQEKTHYKLVSFQYITLNRSSSSRNRSHSDLPVNFEFQIQANLSTFKYFGSFNHHQHYISQFSLLQYAESLKEAKKSHDFANGITTLRLKDNIIQVIEELEEEQTENFLIKNNQSINSFQNIARRDEEVIFENKRAYEDFIGEYTFAKAANLILILSTAALIIAYFTYNLVFKGHHQAVQALTSQIAYQNLIIGAVTKELSLLQNMKLIASGDSPDNVTRFGQIYSDNIAYLQSISLLGASPYQVSIQMGNNSQSLLTAEFLLSFINYANIIYGNMSQAKTQADMASIYSAVSPTILDYLVTNSMVLKQKMMQAALMRQVQISRIVGKYMTVQIAMFVGGIAFIILFAVCKILAIHRINSQRIKILEIFLDISQITIQKFTAKTQKFLLSLHVEDTNGEIDVEEQVENMKKINSSTFAKKKSFRLINFNKSIYVKLLIIPIFACAYFIHSFVVSYIHLNFQLRSYHYFFLTSQADYNFYTGLSSIQSSLINKTPIENSLSKFYLGYYKDYFDLHFETFGYINDFHQAFTSTFMLDTCVGMDEIYGSTRIVQSCEIPHLSSNGSYLVFTDTVMNTQFLVNSSSLTYSYLVGYQVLSKTHRLLTKYLLIAQSNEINSTTDSLLVILLVWLVVTSIVSFAYGVPIVKKFIDEVNEIKNILSILPISVAKELPLCPAYFNKIIRSKDSICLN